MTIKELKEWLKTLPKEMDDRELVLQIDPAGNGYKKVSGFDKDCIFDEGGYEVYSSNWTTQESGMTEEEWRDFKRENKPCVVVYPQ